jgi:DeoR family fructose operon transcriptional repressor
MYAEERQEAILGRAREHGSVDVDGLSVGFGVSAETIRRDLKALEREGLVRRVHGGAIAIERLSMESPVAERDRINIAEKTAIAQEALNFIPENGAILLDAGSTTARLACALPTSLALTVVTNSPAIALLLAPQEAFTVMLLGGRLRSRTLAAVDDWALYATTQIHVDVAFMATNGLSVKRGLTTPDPAEATTKKAMISAARRVILLADHSKVGHDYFARFCDLSDVDLFITDSGLSDGSTATLIQAGLDVVRSSPLPR